MRIYFKPINQTEPAYLEKIVNTYDIIDSLNPINSNHVNCFNVANIKTYTDESRYLLDIFEVHTKRFINKEFQQYDINFLNPIQVIAINFSFDFDFDFDLLSNHYIDFWKNDKNLDYIRPSFSSVNYPEVGYFVFRSLVTSYFSKCFNLIKANNIICFKHDRYLVLAYPILNKETYMNLDDILENFLNALYEMILVTSTRMDYFLPEEKQIRINMKDFYNTYKKK